MMIVVVFINSRHPSFLSFLSILLTLSILSGCFFHSLLVSSCTYFPLLPSPSFSTSITMNQDTYNSNDNDDDDGTSDDTCADDSSYGRPW